ncbi:MAG: hypothetical protein AB201_02300 [Parcubacteria bacterium C7867-006]|nr:MAG: hypothetical protein AB201_02300 [Parcubacteria bacterium C7867-006]
MRAVGSDEWNKFVEVGVKEWHKLRLQPSLQLNFKLEKKVFNAAQVASKRKVDGKLKDDFSIVWLANEIHPIGYATSPVFARAERLAFCLCTALRTLGYGAEPVHDDATFLCYPSTTQAKPQAVSRLGIRISNLLDGNRQEAFRLYKAKTLVSLPITQNLPRLVLKKG